MSSWTLRDIANVGTGAVSFKQTDRTSEALSVKKTRQNPARSPSNLTRSSNLGVLSPTTEEPGSENQEMTTSRQTTPLKSSLKSPSKNATTHQEASGQINQENISPNNMGEDPTVQSLYISSVPTRPLQPTIPDKKVTPAKHVATSTIGDQSTHEVKANVPRRREHIRTPSRIPKPTSQDDLGAGPRKNLKPTFSCDLDSMTAYAVVPGAKILSGTSTMRYQPKNSHTDSAAELANAGSCCSLKSTLGKGDSQAETLAAGPLHVVTPDQMDGAADVVLTGDLCRGSFRDLKQQFEDRNAAVTRPSSYPLWKIRSRADLLQHKDTHVQDQRPSLNTPRKVSPISAAGSRDDLKRGAGKVLGLAAKFDTAAKTSRFMPGVEDAEFKYRREAAGLVSPYTSNPSPLQSITSASTPASLMCRSRDPMALPPAFESARKSRIPRPHHVDSGSRPEREAVPVNARADTGPPLDTIQTHSSNPMLLAPSSPSAKMEVSDTGSVSLAQLDGSSKIPRPLHPLPSRPKITPVAYYSSPAVPTMSCAGNDGLPRLSQHSMASACSDTPSYCQDVSLHNLSSSPSKSSAQGRSVSSLRDQLRSLRQELSSKNEEYAQLHLKFEENRKASQVSEILLREDLDRVKADLAKWKRRAERAESKVERLERTATRPLEIRAQSGGRNHDFSFISGLPDDIDIGERSPQYQPLSARMNQSARRAPENIRPIGLSLMGSDAMSDCSGSTVVRNTHGAEEGHWAPVDELVEIPASTLMNDSL